MRIIVVAVVILSCCFIQDVSGTSLRRTTPTGKERDEALAKEIARLKERQNSVKMHFSDLMGVLKNDNQKAAKATAQVEAMKNDNQKAAKATAQVEAEKPINQILPWRRPFLPPTPGTSFETELDDDDINDNVRTSSSSSADTQSQAAALQTLKEVCKKPTHTDPRKWNAMKGMAHVFNVLDAPYNIHGGTVLGLVRSCSIFDSDVDFAVEQSWLKRNLEKTISALHQAGFTSGEGFGQPDQVGYEKSYYAPPLTSLLAADDQRSNLKAKFETGLATNATTISLFHRAGIKVDLFTIVRASDDYEWGLWIKGGRCPCTTKTTGTVDFSWLGVKVKVPVPLEDVLTSLYGPGYMTPRKWTWNVEPFTIGSCRHDARGRCGST